MAEQAEIKNKAPGGKDRSLFSAFSGIVSSSNTIIGIDAGAAYLKIMQLQKSGSRYGVRSCVTRALPPAARENPAEKKRITQELIRDFINDTRVKSRSARITVSGRGVFIFSLTMPQMNKKDLRGAVGLELKKRLPAQTDISTISYDYFVTGSLGEEKNALAQITCVAADRAVIDEQVQLLKDVGLTPTGIFTIADNLGNLLPFCFDPHPKGAVVLLDMGASVSQLNFYKGHNLLFSREIPLGGDHFTAALDKGLSALAGRAIGPEDVETLKRNWGIPLDADAKADYITDFGQFRGEQIAMMLRPVLERLVMEISRTIQYYVKTFRAEKVEEIYLTGGCSRIKNMDKFLQMNVEGVRRIQPLNILKSVRGWSDRFHSQEMVMEQAAPHLAVAFGMCLANGGRVNLLPMKERLEQKANIASLLLKFAFPAVLLVNLLLYGLVYVNGLKYQALTARLKGEIERLDPSARKVREYQALRGRVVQNKELLEKARGRQPYWTGMLRELSVIIPADITLTKIETDKGQKPLRVRLFGTVYPPQYTIADLVLSQFVMTLEESPYFSQVELVSSKKSVSSSAASADFEISCALNY